MEGQPRSENLNEEIESKIDTLSREGHNEEALVLIESLPNGEEKYYRVAYIGQNYVEIGELEKARQLVDILSQHEDSLPYAGGVLELILRKTGDIK